MFSGVAAFDRPHLISTRFRPWRPALGRSGRLAGKVIVDGRYAPLEQVRADPAWWYRAYAEERAPNDREFYALAEKAARERKPLLRREPDLVPPRAWRRSRN